MFEVIKNLFKPKALSYRWFRKAPKEELEMVFELLSERLMDPTEEPEWRDRIRDYILPAIRKHLDNRFKK